jgi:hypothetical protein
MTPEEINQLELAYEGMRGMLLETIRERDAAVATLARVREEVSFFRHAADDPDMPRDKANGLIMWCDLLYAAMEQPDEAVAS